MDFILFLGTAFGLGAFHALEPGHGKTIIAAYLVGTRGSIWDAILLGLVTALTHTSSVLLLGVVSLIAASQLANFAVTKYIGVISGVSIILVGIWMFFTRVRNLSRGDTESHFHNHVGDHEHHTHAHSHPHHLPEDIQDEKKINLYQILTLGISGGLIPCPAALVVLLASLNSGEIASGMSYLLMFSLGIAVVLVALGLVVCKATDLANRYLEKPGLIKLASIGSPVLIVGMGVVVLWQALVL